MAYGGLPGEEDVSRLGDPPLCPLFIRACVCLAQLANNERSVPNRTCPGDPRTSVRNDGCCLVLCVDDPRGDAQGKTRFCTVRKKPLGLACRPVRKELHLLAANSDYPVDPVDPVIEEVRDSSLLEDTRHGHRHRVDVHLLHPAIECRVRSDKEGVLVHVGPASQDVMHEAGVHAGRRAKDSVVGTHRASKMTDCNAAAGQPHRVDDQVPRFDKQASRLRGVGRLLPVRGSFPRVKMACARERQSACAIRPGSVFDRRERSFEVQAVPVVRCTFQPSLDR